MPSDIPLRALLCDAHSPAAALLLEELRSHRCVAAVEHAPSIAAAQQRLRARDFNVVIIDPLSLGLEAASDFIFAVRKALPEIVFALYLDVAEAEASRDSFYQGERRRLGHYFRIDKRTPVSAFREEVGSVLRACQSDLSWTMSRESLQRIVKEEAAPDRAAALLARIEEIVSRLPAQRQPEPRKGTVFLSYRFAETEYVEGLTELLRERGLTVVTGTSAAGHISAAILERIRECEYFLCLMTRDQEKTDGTFTTSSWLIEEKGAAIALGKPIVLMVEEGVVGIGGLQGDWQRIYFGPKGFLKAALQAAQQLASYAGQGGEAAG